MAADEGMERGDAGTTVVELLVGLALLSLIALFIGQGVGAITRMAPLATRIDRSAELTAVREHLRRTLSETVADLGLVGGAPFRGQAETLAFLAPADPLLEVGGLNEITLALEPGAQGGLDLVERRAIASGDLSRAASRTVLIPDVASLRFAYGEPGPDGTPLWRAAWQRDGAPPALVRIDIGLKAGDRRSVPTLVVHPMATALPPDKRANRQPLDAAPRP
ncbi:MULTISPECIES: hypothetical protein [unclassified Aureimonas]|uniref:hypothetical protein n=1 Tax=unclassified Aureimonas TaxID=2615206 RepID=UPI0007805534|nr:MULTISPECIES: hypothetical protein [unclassified Aureimonas]